MSDMPPKLASIFTESVVEALGYVDPARKFKPIAEPDDGDLSGLPLTATIEFTGDKIKGSVALACTAGFLKATNPIKSVPKGQEPLYHRDWLGEMVNLILGNLKRKLADKSLPFKISTPIYAHYAHTTEMVFETYGYAPYGDDGWVQDFWFECNGHRACLQLATQTDEPFA